MNFSNISEFVFDPNKLSEGMVTIEECKAYTSSIEKMNYFYILACIALFILWAITAKKAGMLDKELTTIKNYLQRKDKL